MEVEEIHALQTLIDEHLKVDPLGHATIEDVVVNMLDDMKELNGIVVASYIDDVPVGYIWAVIINNYGEQFTYIIQMYCNIPGGVQKLFGVLEDWSIERGIRKIRGIVKRPDIAKMLGGTVQAYMIGKEL